MNNLDLFCALIFGLATALNVDGVDLLLFLISIIVTVLLLIFPKILFKDRSPGLRRFVSLSFGKMSFILLFALPGIATRRNLWLYFNAGSMCIADFPVVDS